MESAMFAATGGVNTHKGLIFALSLLVGAWGVLAREGRPSGADVLETAGRMIAPRAEREFDDIKRRGELGECLTHGERAYFLHGIGGVRAEAAKGFPSVVSALASFEDALGAGASYRNAALKALLRLMCRCEDTNVIHRGGINFWRGEYLDWVSEAFAAFDPLGPGDCEPVRTLGGRLVGRGVSPGGAADMLACTLFIYRSKI
jgi:triphosphoribosyl-dephospho-CoA synthetase